jgi:hypothetical protein
MIDWDELSKRLFPVDSWVWRSWNHKLRIQDFGNGEVNQSDFECDVDLMILIRLFMPFYVRLVFIHEAH